MAGGKEYLKEFDLKGQPADGAVDLNEYGV